MASSGIQRFLYFPEKILIDIITLFELKGNLCLPCAHWEFEINFLSFYTAIVRDSCKVETYRCNENDIVALSNLDSKKAEFKFPKSFIQMVSNVNVTCKVRFY